LASQSLQRKEAKTALESTTDGTLCERAHTMA